MRLTRCQLLHDWLDIRDLHVLRSFGALTERIRRLNLVALEYLLEVTLMVVDFRVSLPVPVILSALPREIVCGRSVRRRMQLKSF